MPVPPVLTLTLNPALDLLLEVPAWQPHEVMRTRDVRQRAGGKGINVARMLQRLGVRAAAAGVVGGPGAAVFNSLMTGERFAWHPLSGAGSVRTNVTIGVAGHSLAKINQPGPRIGPAAWHAIKSEFTELCAGRAWVVLAGALPPGLPAGAYAQLIRLAHKAGARVAVDCGGPALSAALPAHPDLIKPNRGELEACLGRQLPDRAALEAGMHETLQRGARAVIVTDGPRALYGLDHAGGKVVRVTPPKIKPVGVVGAGDSCLAGLLAALLRREPMQAALTLGAACGAAKSLSVDTEYPTKVMVLKLIRYQ